MPNSAIFVVSTAIYASIKTLERERSISSFSYYEQLLFTRIHQENEKARGVQDSQHQWRKASPQTFFQL